MANSEGTSISLDLLFLSMLFWGCTRKADKLSGTRQDGFSSARLMTLGLLGSARRSHAARFGKMAGFPRLGLEMKPGPQTLIGFLLVFLNATSEKVSLETAPNWPAFESHMDPYRPCPIKEFGFDLSEAGQKQGERLSMKAPSSRILHLNLELLYLVQIHDCGQVTATLNTSQASFSRVQFNRVCLCLVVPPFHLWEKGPNCWGYCILRQTV